MDNLNFTIATTPTFICTLPSGTDLSDISSLYFAMSQTPGKKIKRNVPLENIDDNNISIYLQQIDTIWVDPKKPVDIQLNWVYSNGQRGATKPVTIDAERNLLPEVLE